VKKREIAPFCLIITQDPIAQKGTAISIWLNSARNPETLSARIHGGRLSPHPAEKGARSLGEEKKKRARGIFALASGKGEKRTSAGTRSEGKKTRRSIRSHEFQSKKKPFLRCLRKEESEEIPASCEKKKFSSTVKKKKERMSYYSPHSEAQAVKGG